MRDEIERAARLVTNQLAPDTRPDDRTVLAHVALLALMAVKLARDRGGHELAILGHIIGMREIAKARPGQVFALVTQHANVRVVDPQPTAIKVHHAHPARRAVERRAQDLLRSPSRLRRRSGWHDDTAGRLHIAALPSANRQTAASNRSYGLTTADSPAGSGGAPWLCEPASRRGCPIRRPTQLSDPYRHNPAAP